MMDRQDVARRVVVRVAAAHALFPGGGANGVVVSKWDGLGPGKPARKGFVMVLLDGRKFPRSYPAQYFHAA